jgi:hypothetical protein
MRHSRQKIRLATPPFGGDLIQTVASPCAGAGVPLDGDARRRPLAFGAARLSGRVSRPVEKCNATVAVRLHPNVCAKPARMR